MLVALLARGILLSLVATAPTAQPARAAAAFAEREKNAGPYAVETLRIEWHDADRDRTVPAKIYYPGEKAGTDRHEKAAGHEADETFPVIIFSHGLGGTREGYQYLGRQWASHGYVCVHVQHAGSDDSVWRGQANVREQMSRAAKDPRNVINRPRDVSFAIDELTKMQAADGPLHGKLKLDAIGVGGHSFGAFTALAIAGEGGNRAAGGRSFADSRVKAAIAMSAPVPAFRKDFDQVYGKIGIPIMHMTGTADQTSITDTKAADRRIPFDNIDKADQYLIIFAGGDHMIFSGRQPRGRKADKDALFQDLIRMDTTAFWDAYLKNDEQAKAWLQSDGMSKAMGKNAKTESKSPKKEPPQVESTRQTR